MCPIILQSSPNHNSSSNEPLLYSMTDIKKIIYLGLMGGEAPSQAFKEKGELNMSASEISDVPIVASGYIIVFSYLSRLIFIPEHRTSSTPVEFTQSQISRPATSPTFQETLPAISTRFYVHCRKRRNGSIPPLHPSPSIAHLKPHVMRS